MGRRDDMMRRGDKAGREERIFERMHEEDTRGCRKSWRDMKRRCRNREDNILRIGYRTRLDDGGNKERTVP